MAEVEYLTVGKLAETEYIVNKSRFIGYCKPVSAAEEAVDFINSVRAKHREAKHNVYAYAVRSPEYSRYSDDGEPQGTAGQPTLDVIRKNGITDVCIVVTRYFGGVLLGAGGLVRAYSHSAGLALESAGIVKMGLCEVYEIISDYSKYERIENLITACDGTTESTDFSDLVRIVLRIHADKSAHLQKKLTDMSNGTVKAVKLGEKFDICV